MSPAQFSFGPAHLEIFLKEIERDIEDVVTIGGSLELLAADDLQPFFRIR